MLFYALAPTSFLVSHCGGLGRVGPLYNTSSLWASDDGGAPLTWRTLLLSPLIYGLIGALLTPVVFLLAARFSITPGRASWLPYLLVPAGASAGLTIVYRGLYVLALYLTGTPGVAVSWAYILASVNGWIPIYWMVLFVAYALDYHDKWQRRNLDAVRLEMPLVQTQLLVLKQQLGPHFLFNTLNAIATLIGDEPRAAQHITAKLGELLHLVLDHTEAFTARSSLTFSRPKNCVPGFRGSFC